jgi:hypothetical protein
MQEALSFQKNKNWTSSCRFWHSGVATASHTSTIHLSPVVTWSGMLFAVKCLRTTALRTGICDTTASAFSAACPSRPMQWSGLHSSAIFSGGRTGTNITTYAPVFKQSASWRPKARTCETTPRYGVMRPPQQRVPEPKHQLLSLQLERKRPINGSNSGNEKRWHYRANRKNEELFV